MLKKYVAKLKKKEARSLNFLCTHKYSEGNVVADAPAKNDQSLSCYIIFPLLYRDILGLPFFRPLSKIDIIFKTKNLINKLIIFITALRYKPIIHLRRE